MDTHRGLWDPGRWFENTKAPQRTVFIYFLDFSGIFFIFSFFHFFLIMPVRYLFIFIGRRADIEYLFIFYWPPSSRYFFHFFILFIFSWQPRSARLGPGLVSKPKCKIFIYFLPSRPATVFSSFFIFSFSDGADVRYLFISYLPPSRYAVFIYFYLAAKPPVFFIFSFFRDPIWTLIFALGGGLFIWPEMDLRIAKKH